MLVKQHAMELARHGITVNGVAPTSCTPSCPPLAGQSGVPRSRSSSGFRWDAIADPKDVVGPALFFCAPAGGFVTGQVLYVDGGHHREPVTRQGRLVRPEFLYRYTVRPYGNAPYRPPSGGIPQNRSGGVHVQHAIPFPPRTRRSRQRSRRPRPLRRRQRSRPRQSQDPGARGTGRRLGPDRPGAAGGAAEPTRSSRR